MDRVLRFCRDGKAALAAKTFFGNWLAHGAAGFGSRDDQFPGRRDVRAQRRAARLAQRLQAAHLEDAGGELELMVPKDRDGQFQTELFERYQRSEKAFVLALMQMYVEGVSTRK